MKWKLGPLWGTHYLKYQVTRCMLFDRHAHEVVSVLDTFQGKRLDAMHVSLVAGGVSMTQLEPFIRLTARKPPSNVASPCRVPDEVLVVSRQKIHNIVLCYRISSQSTRQVR